LSEAPDGVDSAGGPAHNRGTEPGKTAVSDSTHIRDCLTRAIDVFERRPAVARSK
jgi:hypothetical protein